MFMILCVSVCLWLRKEKVGDLRTDNQWRKLSLKIFCLNEAVLLLLMIPFVSNVYIFMSVLINCNKTDFQTSLPGWPKALQGRSKTGWIAPMKHLLLLSNIWNCATLVGWTVLRSSASNCAKCMLLGWPNLPWSQLRYGTLSCMVGSVGFKTHGLLAGGGGGVTVVVVFISTCIASFH